MSCLVDFFCTVYHCVRKKVALPAIIGVLEKNLRDNRCYCKNRQTLK